MTRKCTTCELEKEFAEFDKHKNGKFGLRSTCRLCKREAGRIYRELNKNQIKERGFLYRQRPEAKEKSRERTRQWQRSHPDVVFRSRLKKFGITPIQYEELLRAQNGVCAICKTVKQSTIKTKLHVDHDHLSGEIRGLLCHNCNVTLGLMKDNPDLLRAAADYLGGKFHHKP